jgi:dTDP-glucose 4,6-dehydratase
MIMSKHVLITGAAGFIGSHVARHFAEKYPDWRISVIERLNYASALERLAPLAERLRVVLHDLRAPISDHVRTQLGGIDMVFHLAAETHVDRSCVDPTSFVESNIIGTFNLLEFCRLYQPRLQMMFMISTDEVYGPAPIGIDHTEEFPHRPSNVYSATKAAAEDLCYAYEHSMGVPVIITCTMNNIGIHQNGEKYVPRVIAKLLAGDIIAVHGTPDDVGSRKYLHAMDHANALDFLIANGRRGERYNVVGAEEVSNLDVVYRVAGILREFGHEVEPRVKFVQFHLSRPGHDRRYSLDGTKMAALGWTPPTTFDNTLRKVVRWSLDHREWLKR